MSNDFKEHALEFRKLDGINFADITFLVLETDAVGPVESEYNEVFKRERYDNFVLMAYLSDLLQAHQLAFGTLIVVSRFQGESVTCLGFLYRDDLRIIPLQFESSPHFDAWFRGISAGFQREEVVHRITGTGFRSSPPIPSEPNVYEQTEAFLREHAPQEYRRDAIEAEKRAFLAGFEVSESAQQTVDPDETAALWRALLSFRKDAHAGSGVTDFSAFEAAAGFPFPAELQAIYRQTDGLPKAILGLDLMPFAEVVREWTSWKSIFDQWSLEELTGNTEADGDKTLGVYTNPYWIPFIDRVGGNYMGLDLKPGRGGKVGQIIHFGADTDTVTHVADSLNDLLTGSLQRFESRDKKERPKRRFWR